MGYVLYVGVLTFLSIAFVWIVQYLLLIYETWEEQFGKIRVGRRSSSSPSNEMPPEVIPWDTHKQMVLENAAQHTPEVRDSVNRKLETKETPKTSNRVHYRIGSMALRPSMLKNEDGISKRGSSIFKSFSVFSRFSLIRKSFGGKLSRQHSSELDMDHIYISFPDYLWSLISIGFFSMFLWYKGIIGLKIRMFLKDKELKGMKPCDHAKLVGTICLETTLAIYYYTTENGKASFYFANFPIVLADGSFKICALMNVKIDLETKKMVSSFLDEEELSASETAILLWYNLVSTTHVKMHSLANWGVNFESEQWKRNPFPARNSLVTVIYNHFGYHTFGTFFETWKKWGLLDEDWDVNGWAGTVDEGIKANIFAHPKITDLQKYSKFVSFLVPTRAIFFKEFEKHISCFPGVHPEALFVGTVLHSLDHTMMDRILEDPLWLDVEDPKYRKMAQIGRIVGVGFVQCVPGIYFHKRFKNSGHPFYDSVYEKAAKINKSLADYMDTCIIK